MNSGVFKKVILPIAALLMRNGVYRKYEFLKTTDRWSRRQIEAHQLRSVQRLVAHAFENVPFYHAIYTKAGVRPEMIRSLRDMARLPIVTKKDIRAHHPEGTIAANTRRSTLISNRTAGSTGEPFEFFMDRELTGWKQARHFHTLEKAGVQLGTPYVHIWGQSTAHVLQGLMTRFLLRRVELDVFQIDDHRAREVLERIARVRPTVVESYASAIYALAQYAVLQKKSIHIPILISTAENLHAHQRRFIARTFGCQIIDRYGSREFGNIAQECRNGRMHINEANFYIETVHDRLIVTCFDNAAMPFIRYDIGDLGSVRLAQCGCGSNARVITGLSGRTSDVLRTPSGRIIRPTYLFYVIDYKYGKDIQRFQVVQESPDTLTVRIVPRKSFTARSAEAIRHDLTRTIRDMRVQVKIVAHIPLTTSGKHQAIIKKRFHDHEKTDHQRVPHRAR